MPDDRNATGVAKSTQMGGSPGLGGFAPGTLILTLKGETPVETLAVGDRIIARGVGALTLRRIDLRRWHKDEGALPVLIKAGALMNRHDLVVAPDQQLLIQDAMAQLFFGDQKVLVRAEHLVNGETIEFVEPADDRAEFWTLGLDCLDVVYANGAMVAVPSPAARLGGGLDEEAANAERMARRYAAALAAQRAGGRGRAARVAEKPGLGRYYRIRAGSPEADLARKTTH